MAGEAGKTEPQTTIGQAEGYWPFDRRSKTILLNGVEFEKPKYLKFNAATGSYCFDPTPEMKELGFQTQTFGRELKPADIALVLKLNQRWEVVSAGRVEAKRARAQPIEEFGYPPGTVGWVYKKLLTVRQEARVANGKPPIKKNKDIFVRGWGTKASPRICRFAYWDFRDVTDKEELDLYKELLAKYKTDAQRTTAAFRALRIYAAKLGLVPAVPQRSVFFQMKGLEPRSASWLADEVDMLIDGAIKMGLPRLACGISIAWDSSLSPVDTRTLVMNQLREHYESGKFFFDTKRRKTTEQAVGFLTQQSIDLLLKIVPQDWPDDQPFLRTRDIDRTGRLLIPRPYSEQTFDKDFREVRVAVFGLAEDRRLADLRRSGALEKRAGGATLKSIAASLGNGLDKSEVLKRTYIPDELAAQLEEANKADEARAIGRARLRESRKIGEERGIILLRKRSA